MTLVSLIPAGLWILIALVNVSCLIVSAWQKRHVSAIPLPIGTAFGLWLLAETTWGSWEWALVPVVMLADFQFWYSIFYLLIFGPPSREQ